MALYEMSEPEGGSLLERHNNSDGAVDCVSASLTARGIVRVEVSIDDIITDVVFAGAGGSHTWWTNGGNKLLPNEGLRPGQTLKISADGPCALRIDWIG